MREVEGYDLTRILQIQNKCTVILKAGRSHAGKSIKVKVAPRRIFTVGKIGKQKIELIIIDYAADKMHIEEIKENKGIYDVSSALKAYGVETKITDIKKWQWFKRFLRTSDLNIGKYGVVEFNSYWLDGFVRNVRAECVGTEEVLPGVKITEFFYETFGDIEKSMVNFAGLLVSRKITLKALEKTLRDNSAEVWGENIRIVTNELSMSKTYNNIRFRYEGNYYMYKFEQIENSIDLFIDALRAQSKGKLNEFFESMVQSDDI